jgi:AraC-like DNA-binding protein
MYTEPTTLSDVVRLIEEVLQDHYGQEPAPLLRAAGIPVERAQISGSRIQRDAVMRLWELAAEATGDQSIGLVIGSQMRPTSFYALSMAFLTCETLRDSLELICRYYRVIVTVPLQLDLEVNTDTVVLRTRYKDPDYPFLSIPFDSFIASIVALCRMAATHDFHPLKVRIKIPDNGRSADYERIFNAPIEFNAGVNELVFDRTEVDAPLPGRSVDILDANDRVLENYLAVLNPDEVATDVRKILLSLLPSGKFSRELVASHLHMSTSTLQRRLRDENTNFQELMDNTRRSLAIDYVKERQQSLGDVTFLLGFANQSNFSRAFRRWTGLSPKAYRDALAGDLRV